MSVKLSHTQNEGKTLLQTHESQDLLPADPPYRKLKKNNIKGREENEKASHQRDRGYVSGETQVSTIYKELLQLNNKKTKKTIKNEQRSLADTPQKCM